MASRFIISLALAAVCQNTLAGAEYLHNPAYQREYRSKHYHGVAARQEDDTGSTALFLSENLAMFSPGCSSALVATLNCTGSIREEEFMYTWGGMSAEELSALCTESCSDSISEFRAAVATACADDIYVDPAQGNLTDYVYGTSTTNDVYGTEGKTVGAMALVDYYFLNYNLLCLKDTTGDFCYISTANGTNATVDDCGPCALDSFRLQIEDERSYDAELAEQYSSAVSSCGVTAAPIATPTSQFQNNNVTFSDNTTFSCTGTYVPVETGTSCDQFAETNSMSTDQLLNINSLAGGCADWPGNNTELCVQDNCTPYVVQEGDTCSSVANGADITITQLVTWNPFIDPLCKNWNSKTGHVICLSSPFGYVFPNETISDDDSSYTSITTAAAVPTDAMTESNHHCGKWYSVQTDEYCQLIATKNSITLADFYFLNPEINANCTNLWANASYCIAPVGAITTYDGYYGSSTASDTGTPTTLNTASLSTVSVATYASATATDDTCTTVLEMNDIPFALFYGWNPAIGSDCENLWTNTSYCVAGPGWDDEDAHYYTGTAVGSGTGTGTGTATGTATSGPPGPTQTGIAADCNKWYVAQDNDGCSDIAADNGITLDQFYAWNPAVGSNCENLWPNEAYCIGTSTSSSATTKAMTTTVPAATTTTSATGTTVTPPGPTQSGIPANCDAYALAPTDGTGCYDFAAANSITLDQLYDWNPVLNSDCEK
ncbi:hypothetical protein LQW54_006356 [Pestalotiopsis sp. IQ-011]